MQLFRRGSSGSAAAAAAGSPAAPLGDAAGSILAAEAAARQAAAGGAARAVRRARDPRPDPPFYPECRMPPTSLHEAAYLGDLPSIATFLEKDGVSPDSSDPTYAALTPLHLATQQGQVKAMRALLVAGAFPSPISEEGYCPLHLALLREPGKAQVGRAGGRRAGGSERGAAAPESFWPLSRRLPPVRVLCPPAAPTSRPAVLLLAPLSYLCACLLLSFMRKVNVPPPRCERAQVETVLTLLGMAADPCCPTAQGETPLHLAVALSGDLETIQASCPPPLCTSFAPFFVLHLFHAMCFSLSCHCVFHVFWRKLAVAGGLASWRAWRQRRCLFLLCSCTGCSAPAAAAPAGRRRPAGAPPGGGQSAGPG